MGMVGEFFFWPGFLGWCIYKREMWWGRGWGCGRLVGAVRGLGGGSMDRGMGLVRGLLLRKGDPVLLTVQPSSCCVRFLAACAEVLQIWGQSRNILRAQQWGSTASQHRSLLHASITCTAGAHEPSSSTAAKPSRGSPHWFAPLIKYRGLGHASRNIWLGDLPRQLARSSGSCLP